MPVPYDYLLFEQVQNYKYDYYKTNRIGISFHDAVEALWKDGKIRYGIPEIPDFLSWNLLDYPNFRKLILQIPVVLSDVLNISHSITNDIVQLSTKNRVQISMETCYCDKRFLSVDYFAIIYVLEGNCRLSMQHSSRLMQAGELCILPPCMPYSAFTEPTDLVITIISDKTHFQHNFHNLLYQDNIISEFFRRALFQDSQESLFFMLHPTKDVRSIIQHLFAEFLRKDDYSDILFNNYLQIFYANIIRNTESTYDFYSAQKKTASQTLMPAILQYILQNYRTLSLDLLSTHFHYESAHLSKLIKKATGKNYSQIITGLKIDEAKNLLLNTALSIEAIAEISGYNSADHFTFTFKKVTGLAPRDYRKSFLPTA